MAAHFVSPPCAVDWIDACRSWTETGSLIHTTSSINREPSPPENVSWVRGHGPWCAAIRTHTLETSWSRPRGGMLGRSSTLPEGEGSHKKNWVKRPIFPTLLGYEILEERAKFTVYKILVTGGRGDSWVIFRRYTDFCRLNDKLKELFPSFGLALPPKRWFKDNYDEEFLEERQIGLQTFLQNLTLHKDIISSEAVRHFLCLGYPPSPFDSLEESRAFCENLEDTNHRLQRELLENQREADALKEVLKEKENRICLLVKKVKSLTLSSESFERHRQLKAEIATDPDTHREGDTAGNEEADDDRGYPVTEVTEVTQGHGAYWDAEVNSPVA